MSRKNAVVSKAVHCTSFESFSLGNILINEIIESKDIMCYYSNYEILKKKKIIIVPGETHQHYI